MTMGERIAYYREKQGLTMDQLGEMLGVQRSAINKYEKGYVENIKRSVIQQMAEIFGISPCYLMWGDESERQSENLSAKERELLDCFRACNAAGQQVILATAQSISINPDMKKDRRQKSAG